MIHKINNVTDTLYAHLNENPDITDNNNDNNGISTQNLIPKSPTIITSDIQLMNDTVDEPVDEPVNNVNEAMDTLNENINKSLKHFETNDININQKTIDNAENNKFMQQQITIINSDIDSIEESITNNNAAIDDNEVDISQLKNDLSDLTSVVEIISNTKVNPSDIDDAKNELNSSINTLKTTFDESITTINSSINDRYTKKEVDDEFAK